MTILTFFFPFKKKKKNIHDMVFFNHENYSTYIFKCLHLKSV